MLITALFIIARTWKQPRCPSADEWIRKLWYIYTMEYYSAIKQNTFESILVRWMKLEPIIQSEVSQKEKHQYSISSVQFSCSVMSNSVTPWIATCQASLSITNSWSLPKLMSIESVIPSSHLILCHPLLLLPPITPSIRIFSNESTLHMSWPKYWSFSLSIIPSNEHPGLISFRMDWLDLSSSQNLSKKQQQNWTKLSKIMIKTPGYWPEAYNKPGSAYSRKLTQPWKEERESLGVLFWGCPHPLTY